MSSRVYILWCALAGGIGLLDQWIKHVALERLSEAPMVLLPVLELRLAFNPGAAFGLFGGTLNAGADPRLAWNNLLLSALALVVIMIFLRWLRSPDTRGWQAAGLIFVIGGALGNLVDRLHRGFVVDFIGLHWEYWYFPYFNLADMMITLGVIVLLWTTWRSDRAVAAQKADTPKPRKPRISEPTLTKPKSATTRTRPIRHRQAPTMQHAEPPAPATTPSAAINN